MRLEERRRMAPIHRAGRRSAAGALPWAEVYLASAGRREWPDDCMWLRPEATSCEAPHLLETFGY